MNLKHLLAAAFFTFAALPIVATPVQANPEPMGQRGFSDGFAAMDYNSDNKVDRDEFLRSHPNLRPEAFDAIDINKDKVITREEWDNFVKGHKMEMGMPPADKGQDKGKMGKPAGKMGITPPKGGKPAPSAN